MRWERVVHIMSYIPLRAVQLYTCATPVYNTSSSGVTTTDSVGDTYQEPSGQTRVTMPAYQSDLNIYGEWHVSAGTGTIQLYNFTDSSSVQTGTTTSTTATTMPNLLSTANANISDSVTLRVKNSGAGNTITIDYGGLIQADDTSTSGLSTSTAKTLTFASGSSSLWGFPKTIKFMPIKKNSGTTFTAAFNATQGVAYNASTSGSGPITNMKYSAALNSFSNSDHGTVLTFNLDKIYSADGVSGGLTILCSALSGTATVILCADRYGIQMVEA